MHKDGTMNFSEGTNDDLDLSTREVNYHPSREDETLREADKFPQEEQEVVHGKKVREMIEKQNNFWQAGVRYESFDQDRKDRWAKRVAMTLSDNRISDKVMDTWLGYWKECNKDMAENIKRFMKEFKLLGASNVENQRR